MKRILVPGGAGYIGSVLTRLLLENGYKVRVMDYLRFGKKSLEGLEGNPDLEIIVADIRDAKSVDAATKDVYGVIHLASIVGDPACKKEPQLARETNFDAARSMLEAAQRNGAERFIFASTCSNYGKMDVQDGFVTEESPLKPVSLYAELKVEFENYMLAKNYPENFAAVGLRFATAYGLSPRMRFDLTVNEFTREMCLGRELVVFGEQFWRPYCHIEDISRACIAALRADQKLVHKNVYNVGDTDENYQKKGIVELIKKRIPEAKIKFVHKNEDPRDYRVNFSKIQKELNFSVQKRLTDGIDEILDALRGEKITNPDDVIYSNV